MPHDNMAAQCLPHCRSTPCGVFNGNLEQECGTCSSEYVCRPGQPGFADWRQRRQRLVKIASIGQTKQKIFSSRHACAASLPPAPLKRPLMLALGIISAPGNVERRRWLRANLDLGADGLCVLMRCRPGRGIGHITGRSAPQVVDEVFRQAGMGVTLVSTCYVRAFGTGGVLPVPAVAGSCIVAAVASATNCHLQSR